MIKNEKDKHFYGENFMSTAIVMAAQAPFQHSFALLSTFIVQCPDDLWSAKKGGWPLWQQVGHTLSALYFFAGVAPENPPCAAEVLRLVEQGAQPVDKATMQAFGVRCKAAADAYIAGLTDAALTEENAGLSAALGVPVTHAGALGMLASHTLYHVGGGDAALRDKGLPGVF